MSECKNRWLVRRLLNKILKDARMPLGTAYRKSLKGSMESRSCAASKATNYLAVLKTAPRNAPVPVSLYKVISELRSTAANVRLNAQTRMRAIERLLLIEGVDVPRQDDPTERLICQEMGIAQKPETPLVKRVRNGARNQALADIRVTLNEDIESGRIKTLDDAVHYLRLPELESRAPLPEVSLSELHKAELQAALQLMGRK